MTFVTVVLLKWIVLNVLVRSRLRGITGPSPSGSTHPPKSNQSSGVSGRLLAVTHKEACW